MRLLTSQLTFTLALTPVAGLRINQIVSQLLLQLL